MANKTGRPKSLFSSKLKTWFWYCVVKEITGLKDARLDIKYCRPLGSPPPTRQDYLSRVKAFEIIRLKGGEITRSGTRSKRSFDLLYQMSAHPEVKKTVALYDHVFWEYLSETELSIDRCIELIFVCSKKLNLKSVDWPSDSESMEVEDFIGALDSWEDHTDVPESAFSYSKNLIIFDLLDTRFELIDLNVDDLNRYLNLLTLLGVLYRYSYLRGRLHAALAVEEYLTEHVLPLRELPWLEREFLTPGDKNKKPFLFSEVFFEFVYRKITFPGGLISETQLKTSELKFNRRIKSFPAGSPINEFLVQFK